MRHLGAAISSGGFVSVLANAAFLALLVPGALYFPDVNVIYHPALGLDIPRMAVWAALVFPTAAIGGIVAAMLSHQGDASPPESIDLGIAAGIAYFAAFWLVVTVDAIAQVPGNAFPGSLLDLQLWIDVSCSSVTSLGWLFLLMLVMPIFCSVAGALVYARAQQQPAR